MRLSEAELEIMEQILEARAAGHGGRAGRPAAAKGMEAHHPAYLSGPHGGQGGTKVEKRGKQNVYTACVSSEQYRAAEAQELLTKLYSGSVKSMVAALYDGKALSGDQLDELRDWLETR